jgi:hypothetical protein
MPCDEAMSSLRSVIHIATTLRASRPSRLIAPAGSRMQWRRHVCACCSDQKHDSRLRETLGTWMTPPALRSMSQALSERRLYATATCGGRRLPLRVVNTAMYVTTMQFTSEEKKSRHEDSVIDLSNVLNAKSVHALKLSFSKLCTSSQLACLHPCPPQFVCLLRRALAQEIVLMHRSFVTPGLVCLYQPSCA